MKIENVVIKLPNLSKEYVFLQVSDIHVSYGNSDEPEEHLSMIQEQNRQWSPAGFLPEETMDMLKEQILQSDVSVDAVLMAGDCMNFYSPSNFDLFLEKYNSLPTEILYTPGNHEHWIISHDEAESSQVSWDKMSSLMQGCSDFWVKDYGEFLIVGIDNAEHEVSEHQVKLLKQQMQRGLPIFLLVHIPFYSQPLMRDIEKRWGEPNTYFVFETDNMSDSSKEFCALVRDPQGSVVSVFAGHIHAAHTGEYASGKIQYVSAPLHDLYVRKIIIQPA